MMKRRGFVSSILVPVALLASLAVAAPASAYVNWPGYMFDTGHSSLNGAATTITPANAAALAPAWSSPFTPAPKLGSGFDASPVVYDGYVYIGGNNGTFYQLDETTGAVVHSVFLGQEAACNQNPGTPFSYGVVDTATVAPDPSRGGAPTVYVTGGNGTSSVGGIYLWALDANTLQPVSTWSTDPVTVDTENGAVGWASPMLSNGNISVGIASGCDFPLVRGGMSVFSQADGSLVASYNTVGPDDPTYGPLGGTIWATPAESGKSTWVATGNAAESAPASDNGDSTSIVRLDAATATKQDIWTVPGQTGKDNDFGGSPTLFTASINGTPTSMIGDCNKNGNFYALKSQDLSPGPVWIDQVASSSGHLGCGGALWDAGADQLIIGSTATPNGQEGSIQALSPDDGHILWQSYLPCAVDGVPTEDGAGVLAVVTFSPCTNGATNESLYLFNAHATVPNGSTPAPQLLDTIPLGRAAFGQPAFADGYVFVASEANLMAYAPGPQTPPVTPPTPPVDSLSPPVTPPPSGGSTSGQTSQATVSRAQIAAGLLGQLAPAGKAAEIRALERTGRYTFSFKALTPGRVVISWYVRPSSGKRHKLVMIATGSTRVSKSGRVRITIKLTRTGKRMLEHVRSLRITVQATYTPTGAKGVSATRAVTLKR